MNIIKKIFQNNTEWVTNHLKQNKNYFKMLAKGQSPDILYIGCADSRVTAEEIMGLAPGEMFVHRNIANLISALDLGVLSSIEYAINSLKVKHIVVCGHYGCGGVKAAMESTSLGSLDSWLQNIRDVYRLHQEELNHITDKKKKYERLIEINVQEQCTNILKIASVQRAYREGKVTLHGWIFDINTGKLIDLDINFYKILLRIIKYNRFDKK